MAGNKRTGRGAMKDKMNPRPRTKQHGRRSGGRQAQTRGVSLSPHEAQLVERFQELTGLGFTDQVRQTLVARLPAAVRMAEDIAAADMELGAVPIVDQVVVVESADERRTLRQDTFGSADADADAGA